MRTLECKYTSNGVEFMKTVPQGIYDAIILDAFQNMCPASKELSDIFLESVARALRPGDVMSIPADSFWHKDFVHCADNIANCRKIFKGSVNYAWTTIPANASGIMGFMLCATEGPPVDFKHPINQLNSETTVWPRDLRNSTTHKCTTLPFKCLVLQIRL